MCHSDSHLEKQQIFGHSCWIYIVKFGFQIYMMKNAIGYDNNELVKWFWTKYMGPTNHLKWKILKRG